MVTMKKWQKKCAMALFISGALFGLEQSAVAKSDTLIIQDGSSALSNEQARQQKLQWNQTQRLRSKENLRDEKNFDKNDRAIDNRDACDQSLNVNAYWEPGTQRCLDRRTGRPVAS
ncbi:DUF1283 family protein [Erwinia tracheiphila]|uniref:DUF1283 family protein n=1 Tax=Erwinia tracheiphila TaxID=65700 RepID=A0A0M2KKF3_9GAMM|nr:DUF1283 family protein [Erwinia tracheiphila]AXF78730.1 DUF1283 family protein [Erwinia tracheiphila]KKF37718.1 hypothetical protein SY86_02650 [Erwinia tracheiphila]UIA85692.1 DUF1283 family protein [Erwinia tracheiphila]UIA90099.1 DUF1283 family protein [Erwinia tracheiphila]UIA94220.1 DUF1283 family protein [Erwinia tracheiphila]